MTRRALLIVCLLLGAAVAAAPVTAAEKPRVDVVFCVDCSGSMGPVIETAKQKVWAIVNEIAKAKPSPVLRIGLLGYGNGDRSYRSFPLSDDLDEVYRNLVTFRDEGWGSEFVGLSIHKATSEMMWSAGRQSLKVVYVIGNETARQGPAEFDYSKTAPIAIKNGIIVNAVYCGSAGGNETWREFARLADGTYLEVAANGGAVTVQTPFDKELDTLSKRVNLTYVPFGRAGGARRKLQEEQDVNALHFGGLASSADRAFAKSTAQYNARTWDLVDASREKGFDWAALKDEDLPGEMRRMSPPQRKAYIQAKANERAGVQQKIRSVAAKREAHIKAEINRQGLKGDQSLDEAIRRTIVEQAKRRGFRF